MSKTVIRYYLKVAKDLGYAKVMPTIEQRIRAAKDEHEVERLFIMCRHRLPD